MRGQRTDRGWLGNLLIVLFLSVPIPAPGSLHTGGELTLQRLSDALYILSGTGGNVAFLVTNEGVLVVDSGNGRAQGEEILTRIREITDRPIRYLILTHYHGDHVLGAECFPASAVIVSHDRTRENMEKVYLRNLFPQNLENPANILPQFEQLVRTWEEKAERLRAEKSPELDSVLRELSDRKKRLAEIRDLKVVLPAMTLTERMSIHLGGRTVSLLYLGSGHTNGDLMVWFPEEKAVHMGDLLLTNRWVPRLDADAGGSADSWPGIFATVAGMDVTTIIPGHGEVTDREGFKRSSAVLSGYLGDLQESVARCVRQGMSLDEIKKTVTLPEYRDMEMSQVLLPYNIEAVYRSLSPPR